MKQLIRVLVAVTLLLSAVAGVVPSESHAVSANPMLHHLTQPDGTVFKARQWGDEHLSGWETEDRYTIIFRQTDQTWYFAELDAAGELVPSQYRAAIDEPPPGVPKRLRPTPPPITTPEAKTLSKSLGLATPAAKGMRNIPIVLVNFSDTSPSYSKSAFTDLLFSPNTSSLKDYFREVSYNQFDISPGTGGISEWVTVPKSRSYYGGDRTSADRDMDYWAADLVYEAVQLADAQMDYSEYDSDGDCVVDSVMIVHQGMGQESTSDTNNIWSKSWNLSNARYVGRLNYPGEYISNDACGAGGYVRVNGFTIMPERHSDGGMTTIGIFAHEFGHALGLPDLYDTDYSSEGVGTWSLMAAGNWAGVSRDGDRPAHLDPWSKLKLGWVTPTLVSGTLINEQIGQAATNADVYQLRAGSPDSGEYFLVENRQKTGFDAGLPGSGLLIWHVDGDKIVAGARTGTVNNYECYPPSICATAHYGVALMQADGNWSLERGYSWGDAGDPFPGTGSRTDFSNVTTPGSKLWSGVTSNVSVSGISSSASTMTATLSMQACTFALSAPSAIHTSTGGAGSFQLQTGSGCAWTATDSSSWITLLGGSSGSGTATVDYLVSANTTGSSRTGSITIGGLAFNVIQSATASSSTLYNGDFEQGATFWDEYTAVDIPIINSGFYNHTAGGTWSAFLGGYNDAYDLVTQTVTIPDDATQAALTFYRRIETSEGTLTTAYDELQVLVLDQYDAGNVLASLKTYSNLDASSDWVQSGDLDLAQFRGRTIRLAFLATTDYSEETSFFIDDVNVSVSNTSLIAVYPMQRVYQTVGGSGSIEVTGTGPWTARSNVSWITVVAGASGSNSGRVTYSVAGNAGQSERRGSLTIGEKTVVIIQEGTAGTSELLVNGSFENGAASGWIQSAQSLYTVIGNYTEFAAHSGQWYAYLADYEDAEDAITQTVAVPSAASSVYLQYYYSILTSEFSNSTQYDQMWVYVSDASGNLLATLQSYSNLDDTQGWRQSEAFDLTAYRGRTIKLTFKAANDGSYNTAFLVDDVQLRVLNDATPPTVISVTPAENASGIPVSSAVTVTFSEQVSPSTINANTLVLKKDASTVLGDITYDSVAHTARLTPRTPLAYGGNYVVTVTTGVKDATGIGLQTARTWSFSTESDRVAPVIAAFTVPALSGSLSVAILSFTATDAGGVTGYLVTETSATPLASAAGWSSTAPASYTFSTVGTKTLYAWAKDAAGNISAAASAVVTVGSSIGDCDDSGSVSIAEVQSSINMFLGLKSAAGCVDSDGSGQVSISEVQKVINSYLGL